LHGRETLKPTPGAAGGTVDQNWGKVGQNLAEAGRLVYMELKSERQNGNSSLSKSHKIFPAQGNFSPPRFV
jgi:hypothetical protein